MIYVDNGAFVFENRTDIEKGITLTFYHFTQFGLTMHIGTDSKPQRLNAYFPSPRFIYLTHEHYRPLISPTPHCTYRRKKVINIDAHVRNKNTPSAEKQQSSK